MHKSHLAVASNDELNHTVPEYIHEGSRGRRFHWWCGEVGGDFSHAGEGASIVHDIDQSFQNMFVKKYIFSRNF